MTNGKNKADKKQNRRDFLKVAGAAGAAVAMGAVLGPQQVQSQQPRPGAFCLEPKGGFLSPTPEVAKQLIEALQRDLNANPALRSRYVDNPRVVMGERGFGLDLINEVLSAHGFPQAFRYGCSVTCIITSCGKTIVIGGG